MSKPTLTDLHRAVLGALGDDWQSVADLHRATYLSHSRIAHALFELRARGLVESKHREGGRWRRVRGERTAEAAA